MKTLLSILTLSIIFISSCTETVIGPQGPRGDQGPVGPIGADGESAFVFEYENIDFTRGNNYQVFLPYPSNFEGFGSDVALVYLLWNVEEVNGEDVEVWRSLSQQVLFTDGTLQYNYDFSSTDVRLFMEANFSLDELTAVDTDGWVARVVVVPGSFWDNGRVDVSDYNKVEEMLGLPKLEVERNDSWSRRE
ncbi:MAG: collagen-like protein [Cyclobacteriaceae bacterium]